MGKHMGELAKMYGIVTYSLSPFEQRAFGNAIRKGIPNMWRRFREQVFIVTPGFIFSYMLIDWGTKENLRISRKNPEDYANDV